MTTVSREEKREYLVVSVLERGEEIFAEWKRSSLSSKKIVAEIERTIEKRKKKNSPKNRMEAFAYLCALEKRISERYSNFLACFFRYFSWKRETEAIKRLRLALSVPSNRALREALEIEANLTSDIDIDDNIDELDTTSGGKKGSKKENGKESDAELEKGEEKSKEAEESSQNEPDTEADKKKESEKDAESELFDKPDEKEVGRGDKAYGQKVGADEATVISEEAFENSKNIQDGDKLKIEIEEGKSESSSQRENNYNPNAEAHKESTQKSESKEDLRFLDDELIGYRETPEELFGSKNDLLTNGGRESSANDGKIVIEQNLNPDKPNAQANEIKQNDIGHLYDKNLSDASMAGRVQVGNNTAQRAQSQTQAQPQAQTQNKVNAPKNEPSGKINDNSNQEKDNLEISEQEENELRRNISEALAAEPEFIARYIEASVDAVKAEQVAIQNDKVQISILEARGDDAPIAVEKNDNASSFVAPHEIKK